MLHTELVNIPCTESVSRPNSRPTVRLRQAPSAAMQRQEGEENHPIAYLPDHRPASLPSLASHSRPHTLGSVEYMTPTEEGNRQNRLHPESCTPARGRLYTVSSVPSIYGNDIPTGKPGPRMEEPQGSYLDSPS